MRLSRRSIILGGTIAALPGTAACRGSSGGRLRARPQPAAGAASLAEGVSPIGVWRRRDALIYRPAGAADGAALPLLVLLHGAGGDGREMIESFRARADTLGFAILAPQSIDRTWPIGAPLGGPEIAALDAALAAAFAKLRVDASRIAIGGFSDGASYALSLGFANGGLFSDILAFSAGGFVGEDGAGRAKPRVFLGHGRTDRVLPFSNAEAMAAIFRRAGYDVQFYAFDGGHRMTGAELDAGLSRFLGATPA